MRFFDKQFSFCLAVLFLILLFLPKINLLSVGAKETAGIRVDDILLLFFCLILFWAHFSLHKTMSSIERALLSFIALGVFSFIMNKMFVAIGLLRVNASIFYSLRLAEYFLFFYIGSMAALFFKPAVIINAFFLWNFILMVLQKVGWIGQFTVTGYVAGNTDRVTGISSFPSEAGMLLNMAFCYLIYNEEKSKRFSFFFPAHLRTFFQNIYIYLLFLTCTTLVIITGSRIAIFALIIAFLYRVRQILKRGSMNAWILALAFLICGALLTTVMIQKTEAVAKRSSGLLSFKNFELIGIVWDRIDLEDDPVGQETIRNDAYDMSWWMRIHKWCYAAKIYYLNPECYLQGVGPGFAMAALDGGWLRLLTENGLLGCFFFYKLFQLIFRQSMQLRWMVITFFINMIFFDVYLAYKPMSLLFFISGCTYCQAIQKAKQSVNYVPLKV